MSSLAASFSAASRAMRFPSALPEIRRLPCGLRVAMTPTPVSELGVVGIHVCWGSRWESKEDNGAAHFLEHLLCKGSTHFSRNETYELFDHLGCSFNAFTNRETMSYFIHFLPRSAERALPVFTDSIILPALASDAHREERLHIRAEIESVANDIRESIFDVAHATAYSCSMGLPVLGPLHNVEKVISPSSLRALHNRVVTPDRMLFSVSASAVGGSMDTAIAWANKFVVPALETKAANAAKGAAQAAPPSSPGIFGRILGAATGGAPAAHIPSTHAVPLPPPGTVPLAQWVGGCAGVAMPLPRTHAVLGFRGYGVTNPKELAVHNVLLSLLGSHDPGIDAGHAVTPLTRALLYGDSDAHAHSGCDVEMIVDPFCFPYGKEALTGLYTSVATRGATGAPQGATSLARVVRTFFDELGRAATAITDDELDVARSKALRDTLLQNECPRFVVNEFSRRALLSSHPSSINDQLDALVSVTAGDVRDLINSVYGGRPLAYERVEETIAPMTPEGPAKGPVAPVVGPGEPRKPVLALMGDLDGVDLDFQQFEEFPARLRVQIDAAS